jgi:periplasmic divalent cation tolerance protein
MAFRDVVLAVSTFGDAEVAMRAVRELLDQRVIACGTVLPGATSIYRWEGKTEEAKEVVVLFKTTSFCVDALKRALTAVHPYQTPELLVLPAADGLPAYLDWVAREVISE